MQNGNSIRKLFGFLQILGCQEYSRAISSKLFDDLPNLDTRFRIKTGGRFVKKNKRRVPDQTRGNVKTTTHTAGIGRSTAIGSLGQHETVKQILRYLIRIANER